jgi:hypothetical protein
MLHPVTLEDFDAAIVHADGHGHDDAAAGALGAFAEPGVHAEDVGSGVELVAGLLEYRRTVDRLVKGHGDGGGVAPGLCCAEIAGSTAL